MHIIKSLVKTVLLVCGALIHRDQRAKVVFYHDIGKKNTPMGTDEKTFMKHMKVLGVGGRCRRRGGVVAFDDGFRGVWEYRNELEKIIGAGVRVIVFIAVRLVRQPGYLTWDEIRKLQREYGVKFQCHTWSHQTLVGPMIDESPKEERTEAWYHRELVESRAKIAAEIGTEVDELCFPVGYFSDELIERCKAAGYKKVYASYPGNVCEGYVQPRCIAQDLGVIGFWAMLRGGMNVFKSRYYRAHKWLEV